MAMPPPTVFNRDEAMRTLGNTAFDVLVIGGGITGCGVAVDAAARGLSTALVERGDFGSGTSSKSSKLVHGGLRYLSQHDYRLVFEALTERQRLLRNAPHLVHPLPFLIPLFGRQTTSSKGVAKMTVAKGVAKAYSIALWTYDVAGGLRIGRRHRRINAATAVAHVPQLRTDQLAASFLYWDAQADDARLTLALARTATLTHGAVMANHVGVTELVTDPGTGRVTGARLDNGIEVRAGCVVNAGGVWSEEVADLPGGEPLGVGIRPAKGIHVTVASHRLPCDYASVLQVPGEKRSVFAVPWEASQAHGPSGAGRYTYLGTTDTDYHGPLDAPQCSADDIDYLLRTVNTWTSAALTRADVTSSWAGLRPLIRTPSAGARNGTGEVAAAGHPVSTWRSRLRPRRRRRDKVEARTADLSRHHQVITSPNGMVTVTGGKLTTYRRMAADAVDEVMRSLDREPIPSPTAKLMVWGGDVGESLGGEAAARELGFDTDVVAHLRGRYGSEARVVAAMCRADPELRLPLVDGLPYLRAEVVFAARYEMAITLEDVLSRRTRALILNRHATRRAAQPTAELLADELGWSPADTEEQVAALCALIDAEEAAAGTAANPDLAAAAGTATRDPAAAKP